MSREKRENQQPSAVLEIKRVAKVTRGKKRIRFTALVAVGDKQGKVGLALAKAPSVAAAIQKGMNKAKQEMIGLPITSWYSVPHRVEVKQDGVWLLIKPAPQGSGLKAGGVVRTLLDLAGYQNVVAKLLGSSNRTVAAYATLKAFKSLENIKKRRL